VELLFVVLIGVVLGLAGRSALPHRDLTGLLLLPAIGGAAGAVVWVALTWARMRWDGGLIWVFTILAAALTVTAAGVLIGRTRAREDDRLFAEVAGGA
jgi:quaternary ammonium compound-resistance protein SugE